MESFGDYLKAQREKKGIRLEEIASITKIHLHNLELLEKNRWDDLPPEPFLRGFITAYAKYVGLEPKDVLTRFYEEKGGEIPPPAPLSPPDRPSGPDSTPPSKVIEKSQEPVSGKVFVGAGIAAVLMLAIGVTYFGRRSAEKPVETTTATTESAPAADASAPTAPNTQAAAGTAEINAGVAPVAPSAGDPGRAVSETPATAPVTAPVDSKVAPNPNDSKPAADAKAPAGDAPPAVTAASPAPATVPNTAPAEAEPSALGVAKEEAKHEIRVENRDRTWVKVVIDDQPPQQLILKENEKAVYRAKDKIKVVLGYANGAKVYHNGELNEGTKFAGTIRYYRFPNNARFPQDSGTKRTTQSGATESGASESKELAPLKELLSQ